MINFFYEVAFRLSDEMIYADWLSRVLSSESKSVAEINYIFCDDEYLLDINQKYLNHDTYTDIITFDYSVGNVLQGDIYISTERVSENASEFSVSFQEELLRVMAHGVLHMCGFKDKSLDDISLMREKENEKINMFHVEQ